jgi:hypothetical protein
MQQIISHKKAPRQTVVDNFFGKSYIYSDILYYIFILPSIKMKTPSRLTRITVFHAIFAGFGDVEANTLNYMAVPIRNFFADSLKINYGIDGNSQESVFSHHSNL